MLSRADNETITRVGPGTPMGNYLRRFWTPILLSSELPDRDGDPVETRILSEDVVLFRDTNGTVGMLEAMCPHRQAPLFYGRNEEGGLRCIYHGWKFDHSGKILELPNEPPESKVKDHLRAVAYPTQEWAGIIWAYLGPAQLKPQLPQLEWGLLPESHLQVLKYEQLCNWVQALEGDIDSSHISFLHRQLNTAENRISYNSRTTAYTMQDTYPRYDIVEKDYGLMMGARRNAEEDTYYWRITQWMHPYFTLIGSDIDGTLGFGQMYVPIDDTHTRVWAPRWRTDAPFTAEQRHENVHGKYAAVRTLDPKTGRLGANLGNHFMQDRQVQRTDSYSGIPGIREQDTAVAEGMGPIVDRSKEHLVAADAGVAAMRRALLDGVRDLQNGKEPYAASHGAAYRVRAWSKVLNRDLGSFTNDPDFQKLVSIPAR